jgi:MFS family permease
MTYADWLGLAEIYWLVMGVVGAMLCGALLSRYANERRSIEDIPTAIGRQRAMVMANALILGQSLLLVLALLFVALAAIAFTVPPNPNAVPTPQGLTTITLLNLIPTFHVILSAALIYAYWKIDHFDERRTP